MITFWCLECSTFEKAGRRCVVLARKSLVKLKNEFVRPSALTPPTTPLHKTKHHSRDKEAPEARITALEDKSENIYIGR